MSDVIDIILRIKDQGTGTVKEVTKELKTLDKEAQGVVSRGLGGFEKMLKVGLVGAVAAATIALTGLGGAMVGSISKAANMEQGVADIAATMQLTSEETAQFKDLITDLGLDPKLKVTATEASQAIGVLGTAGLEVTDILDGAARSTVLLANSTGADFAQAGAIASDVMAQFNIEAKDMASAVDQITGVTVASKFDINDYALALAQAGGVAGSVGVEFDDFNAAIAAISPSFASGSDAGTSFKTFLTTLIPKSEDAASVMNQLGLSTTEWTKASEALSRMLGEHVEPNATAVYQAYNKYADAAGLAEIGTEKMDKKYQDFISGFSVNQFFDANGALKDMSEIAGILQDAFGDLSEAQRIEAAQTIFGSDAMRAAFALMDAGAPGIEELKRLIGDTSAEESAAIRMDTFSGALEIAQGIIDTISMSIGDKFLPVLRPLIERFTELAQVHGPALIEMFGEFAGRLSAFIDGVFDHAVVAFEDGSGMLSDFLQVLGLSGDTAQRVGQRYFDFVHAVKSILSPVTDAISRFISWKDVLGGVGALIAITVIPIIAGIVTALTPVIATVAAVVGAVALLRRAWESDWLGIRGTLEAVWEVISEIWSTVTKRIAILVNVFEFAWASLAMANATLGEKLALVWKAIRLLATTVWEGIVDTVSILLPKFVAKAQEWGTAAWEWVGEAIPTALKKIQEWGESLWGWLAKYLPEWIDKLTKWGTAAWQWITDATSIALRKITEWGSSLWEWTAKNLPKWVDKLSDWATAAWQWIRDAVPVALSKLSEWGKAVLQWLGDNLPTFLATIFRWGEALYQWIGNVIPNAINSLADFIRGIREKGEGEGTPAFMKMAGEWATKLWRWIVDDLVPQAGPAFMGFISAMLDYGIKLTTAIGHLAKELGLLLWQWIVQVTPIAWEKIQEWGKALWKWIDENLPQWMAKLGRWSRAAWEWIVEAAGPALEKLGEWGGQLWNWLVDNLPEWLTNLCKWARAAWEWIVDVTPEVVRKLGEWGSKLWNWLTDNLPEWLTKLGKWASAAWEWIVDVTPDALRKLGEWGSKLWGWLADNLPEWLTKLGKWALAAWEWIVDVTPTALTKLGEWGGKLWNWIVDNAPEWAAKLGEWGKAAWQWIVDAGATAITKLGEWGGNLIGWVTTNVSGWVTSFTNAGRDIIAGLWQGIQDKWENFTNWFGGVWGGLVDRFKNFFGIHSPSTVFQGLGENLMQGLDQGVDNGMLWVTKSLEDGSRVWENTITGKWLPVFSTAGQEMMRGLGDGIQSGMLWVKATLENGAQMWRNTMDGSLRPILNNYSAMIAQAQKAEKDARSAWEAAKIAAINAPAQHLDIDKLQAGNAVIKPGLTDIDPSRLHKSVFTQPANTTSPANNAVAAAVAPIVKDITTIGEALGQAATTVAGTSTTLLGGINLMATDVEAVREAQQKVAVDTQKTINGFIAGFVDFIKGTLNQADDVFGFFKYKEDKAFAQGTLQEFVSGEMGKAKEDLRSLYNVIRDSIANLLGVSAESLAITGPESLQLIDRLKAIKKGTTSNTDIEMIGGILQNLVDFRSLANFGTGKSYYDAVLPNDPRLTGGNTVTNNYTVQLQGSGNASADVLSTISLLQSLGGTAL